MADVAGIVAPGGTGGEMGIRQGDRTGHGVLAVLAALTASMVLAACGSTPSPASTVTAQAGVTPNKSAGPTPTLPATWPLTGVPGDVVSRPALAVKIENTSQARPQTGLEQADVVWETIVEFDVSRFIAVFHSQVPAEIGPIRSVRPMDPPAVGPTHGLFVFSGGQAGILALVRDSPLQAISHDAGAPGLYRISARSAPHNVYGDPKALWAQADAGHQAPPPEQFVFARTPAQAAAVAQGRPATSLSLRLSAASSPAWSWDAGTGTWLRSEGSVPATAASGARLSAVNVVSITASHPASGFGAQNGASVPTYTLVGSGDGVVATGGQVLDVHWRKDSADAPLQLFTANGAAAPLAPGNTWVELVPAETGSLTIG